jgi:hypothetical protein
LEAGYSPEQVATLAGRTGRKWSFFFIDGNHEAPAPRRDAAICAHYAEPDAAILFHDLASPDVAQGLDYLKRNGWQTCIYHTMQIMGVAWRGKVQPLRHEPDARVHWCVPAHLEGFPDSRQVFHS